jgi:tetratricopeptide (TPR) repeat protein
MRTAALLLLRPEEVMGPYLTDLDAARIAAKTELDRGRLTMQLAYAHSAQEHWAEMLPLAEELTRSFPTSVRAFEISVTAYSRLHRFDRWERLVNRRMREQSGDVAYIRSAAQLAASRQQFQKSREIIKGLIDKGQATANDLNLYAWYALLISPPIGQDTIDAALRATDMTNNANFAMLQTLGCVYAAVGDASQSRELLLKAMDSLHLDKPNSEVWFGWGLIAEQYGEFAAATQMFRRVERPDLDGPGTPYALAQKHLAALASAANDSAQIATR